MARELAQIMTELDAVYRPQRDLYNQQLGQQDPQMEAEQKGLMAQKEDSFRQITDQANRRGMFYSGLPIAEEQRYTGQQFLPAMANLAGKYKASKDSLAETLFRLDREQNSQAYGIQDKEKAIDEQLRQEAEQRRQFDAQLNAQRAAAGSGSGLNLGGGGGGGGGGGAPTIKVDPNDQILYDQMFFKQGGGKWSDQDLVRDYNQTLIGARNGNARDIKKIQFYHSSRADIFGSTQPSLARSVTVNTGQRVGVVGPQPSLRQQSGGLAIPALGIR